MRNPSNNRQSYKKTYEKEVPAYADKNKMDFVCYSFFHDGDQ